MLRISTGLANGMCVTSSMKEQLEGASGDGFLIDIYSGTRPATPDLAATGTKLVTISLGSAGTAIHLGTTAASGVVAKASAETWGGNGLATGTAGYFRIRTGADTGATDSTSAVRIDGTVATSGGDMNLTGTSVAVGAPFIISAASISLPLA
jgi:hypothetical protein